MTENSNNRKVNVRQASIDKWHEEKEKLREIALSCQLTEELKWGWPCFTCQGKNIIIIQGFKDYCALLFFKGSLLNDPDDILVKTGENTQVGRQVRFQGIADVAKVETILKKYIAEAVEIERAGIKVPKREAAELLMPEEFTRKLEEIPGLKTAFASLTPGRQRAYIFFFSEPIQAQTRESRIEKSIPKILRGEGLNDAQRRARK